MLAWSADESSERPPGTVPSGGLQSMPPKPNKWFGALRFQISIHLLIKHKRILNCVWVVAVTQLLAINH